jgi:gas vesicle protein
MEAIMNNFLKLLLGTTLYVLEQSDKSTRKVRSRAADNLDDLRDLAQEKYAVASDRASQALMGDDNRVLSNVLSLAAGIGIGVGIGLIFAPAGGEETREAIADKVQVFGDKVKKQFSSESDDYSATGTNG